MASGACESRNEGRTHGRTNQRTAAFPKNPCQRRAVHTRTAVQIGRASCREREWRRWRRDQADTERRGRGWEGRIGADARSRLKPPDRENPLWPVHLECVLLVGTGSARKASWPAAHVRAATKAEHMAAPTSELQRSQKTLANGEPSTHGEPSRSEERRVGKESGDAGVEIRQTRSGADEVGKGG